MRTIGSGHSAALGVKARVYGVVERDLFWLRGQDALGDDIEFAFWVGRVPVSITVNAGYDEGTPTRTYVGGGSLISVDDTPEALGFEVRRTQVVLNHRHSRVQAMFRGAVIGLAEAECHRVLLDPVSHNQVEEPYIHFMGQVNMAPETRPRAGGSGQITLDIVSDLREYTRTNPIVRGNPTHKRFYPGDDIVQYASEAALWELPWGTAETGGKGR